MNTSLPFLFPLTQAAAAPLPAAAEPAADSGAPGAFNALIDAQMQTPAPALPVAPQPAAVQDGAAMLASATDTQTTPQPATDQAATPNDAPSDTPPPVIVVPAGVPSVAPSEEALTQAIGGKDDGAEAAGAAVAAAIEVGVAPQPSERIVLAASLPVGVRSAASVRVLDRLLDGLATPQAPTFTDHLAAPASAKPAQDMAAAASPLRADAPAPIQAEPATQAPPPPADVAPTASAPRSPAISTEPMPAALAAETATPLAPAQPATNAPADATATVQRAAVEPAIASNGEGTARANELLRQHVRLDGFDGTIRVSLDQATNTGRSNPASHAAFQGGLVAPTTAAALAAQGALASNPNGHAAPANNAGPAGQATVAAAAAPAATGTENFFGGNGAGGFGADANPMLPGTNLGDAGFTGLDAGVDGAESFGALLNGQAASSAARPAVTTAAPMPTTTPQAVAPEQLAVQIAAAARNGAQNLSLQLRPAALGRIDVQLSVGRDGTVRAKVLAERAETLELLQRHADGLEHALEAAGLHAETGGLSFGLKDGGNGNGQSRLADAPLLRAQAETTDGGPEAGPIATQPLGGFDGRALDIRV
ncbi:MAG: flagellar hook-length control protein FliK [Alphaproteobacteria bacterium]